MSSPRRSLPFLYRLRESLVILFGRLPRRLTTVDALTTAQGELAQSRAELGQIAKAAAEARARLSVVELELSRLREDNAQLRLESTALKKEMQGDRAVDASQS